MNIEFLAGVVSLIAYEFDIIPKSLIVIILTIFFLLSLFNSAWLNHKVGLIKEYNSLMILLKNYNMSSTIERMFTNWNPASHIIARQYFETKQADINKKFNELNKKLYWPSKIKYCLIITNFSSIGKDIAELYIDIRILNEYFGLDVEESEFESALKKARSRFAEIKNAIPE